MREKLAILWPKAPMVEAIGYSLNRWERQIVLEQVTPRGRIDGHGDSARLTGCKTQKQLLGAVFDHHGCMRARPMPRADLSS
ncbi:hypothetical protein [Paraburkholderia fynbosensis]|uniref:Uncharacterized protein n=1 Tax=Paraburkholderia fynbosensis TaxID=1200993 RepID=A0A6J5GLT9_9BURK|nr:hypothetical protein [Paraburkholderia fynbosensis]CAB3802762.1 hypothetical protein LMG27177_05286 [Paraburkholderia fynbosensis]